MEITINNEDDKKKLYEYLKNKAIPYRVVVDDNREKRSNRQNSYYHGVVIEYIAKHLGLFPDEVKSILAHKFLLYARFINGVAYPYAGHTSGLTTKEMEILNEQIRIWGLTELGLKIPLPNEPTDEEPLMFDNK